MNAGASARQTTGMQNPVIASEPEGEALRTERNGTSLPATLPHGVKVHGAMTPSRWLGIAVENRAATRANLFII